MKRKIPLIVIGAVFACTAISLSFRFLQNFWTDRYFSTVEAFEEAAYQEPIVLEDSGYYAIRNDEKTIFGYPRQEGAEAYIWDAFPFQPQNCKNLLRSLTNHSILLPDKSGILHVVFCVQIHEKTLILMNFTMLSDSKTFAISDMTKKSREELSLPDGKKRGEHTVFFIQNASEEVNFYINEYRFSIKDKKLHVCQGDG